VEILYVNLAKKARKFLSQKYETEKIGRKKNKHHSTPRIREFWRRAWIEGLEMEGERDKTK